MPKTKKRVPSGRVVAKEKKRKPKIAKCANCGKKTSFGRNRPWSKKSTPRTFKPNLQTITVVEGNKKTRQVLCAKCIRTMVKT